MARSDLSFSSKRNKGRYVLYFLLIVLAVYLGAFLAEKTPPSQEQVVPIAVPTSH